MAESTDDAKKAALKKHYIGYGFDASVKTGDKAKGRAALQERVRGRQSKAFADEVMAAYDASAAAKQSNENFKGGDTVRESSYREAPKERVKIYRDAADANKKVSVESDNNGKKLRVDGGKSYDVSGTSPRAKRAAQAKNVDIAKNVAAGATRAFGLSSAKKAVAVGTGNLFGKPRRPRMKPNPIKPKVVEGAGEEARFKNRSLRELMGIKKS